VLWYDKYHTGERKKVDGRRKGGTEMFRDFIKERRIEKGLTLREFCRMIEVDPSNWSKIERGVLSPPQDGEKLQRIAEVLDIAIGSEIWQTMKDSATIDVGNIPEDIMSDQRILESLPMFFRTIRSEKPTVEELESLIRIVKEGI